MRRPHATDRLPLFEAHPSHVWAGPLAGGGLASCSLCGISVGASLARESCPRKRPGGLVHSSCTFSAREPARITGLARKVRGVIKLRVGRAQAIKSDEIARLVGQEPSGTNAGIRRELKELLCCEGLPVCSCREGFFLARTQDEIGEAMTGLRVRMEGLARDIQALQRAGVTLRNAQR